MRSGYRETPEENSPFVSGSPSRVGPIPVDGDWYLGNHGRQPGRGKRFWQNAAGIAPGWDLGDDV